MVLNFGRYGATYIRMYADLPTPSFYWPCIEPQSRSFRLRRSTTAVRTWPLPGTWGLGTSSRFIPSIITKNQTTAGGALWVTAARIKKKGSQAWQAHLLSGESQLLINMLATSDLGLCMYPRVVSVSSGLFA